jgi:trimeric autotransporter adhesin
MAQLTRHPRRHGRPQRTWCGCIALLWVVGVLPPATAQTYTINTVAGGGVGDGGAATSAYLQNPSGVAADSFGNLYIADTSDNRIRKLVLATGIITTVAGNGPAGFSGDGGSATAASLNGPYGVAVDTSGNLYIADTGNNRIREVVVRTGVIVTVAGNGTRAFSGDGAAATNASLNSPAGLAVDTLGNIFIADRGNNRIREVSAATGNIATFAGNGTVGYSGDGGPAIDAAFQTLAGIALDSSGNLLISDQGNNSIRKVTAASGTISTFAGSGFSGYSGDGGDPASATLSLPRGVAADSNGDVYIADSGNNVVREVLAATNTIITVAGNGIAGFSGDGGLATSARMSPLGVVSDPSGNLYIADGANDRIRKVTTSTGFISTVAGNGGLFEIWDGSLATGAALNSPAATVIDAAGNLYIADAGNNRIRKVEAATGIINTVAGNGTAGSGGDGGFATNGSLNDPEGIAVDSLGNLFIGDSANNRVRQVALATGIISTVAGGGSALGDGGPATSASLDAPSGVVVDADGNLYTSRTPPIIAFEGLTQPQGSSPRLQVTVTPATTIRRNPPPRVWRPPAPASGPPTALRSIYPVIFTFRTLLTTASGVWPRVRAPLRPSQVSDEYLILLAPGMAVRPPAPP